jgi:hypothetical protein
VEDEKMDYHQMTAPCGLPCFECYLYLANENEEYRARAAEALGLPLEAAACQGCRSQNGICPHHPHPCRVYQCIQQKEIEFCFECTDFPCDFLHPYADRHELWHNTKVFNLCLIKKMGLEAWAKTKAASVLEAYSFGEWRL